MSGNFSDGLNKLITRTLANKEGGWFANTALITDKVSMDKTGVITISLNENDIYLRFANSQWSRSIDKKTWEKTETFVSANYNMTSNEKNILSNLTDKSKEEGHRIIFLMGNDLKYQ